jgi:hypothetical protein
VPSAVVVTPYSASLAASGGQPPYQWSVASGSLPAGLQLGASTGTLWIGYPSRNLYLHRARDGCGLAYGAA